MIETEVGYIPEDWEVVNLGKIGPFYKGAGISREDSHSGSIPAVRYGELYTIHNNYIFKCTSFISPQIAKQSRRMRKGYILFTGSGETKEDIGKAVAFLHDYEAYAGGDLIILSPKKSYDSLYLGYILNSSSVIRQRTSMAQGDSVVHITADALKELHIPLPPTKDEQTRIASALYDIDTLIRNLDRTIEKKKNIRQGAMEELLSGQKRLPGFQGEWIELKVSEIGKLSGAGVDKKSNINEMPVRLVNFLDVYHRNRIANSELNHWVTATPEKVNSCNVKRGDVFFTPSSEMPDDIGQSAVAVEDMPNVCYSYHIYRLRPNIELDPGYSAYAFQNKYFFDQVKVESEGSGKRYVVSLNKFKELYALLPPTIKEQQAIADTLTAMDDEIATLQLERDKYANIRSGMMDDLLSGIKRI